MSGCPTVYPIGYGPCGEVAQVATHFSSREPPANADAEMTNASRNKNVRCLDRSMWTPSGLQVGREGRHEAAPEIRCSERSADPAVARLPGLHAQGQVPLPVHAEVVLLRLQVLRVVIRRHLPKPLQ